MACKYTKPPNSIPYSIVTRYEKMGLIYVHIKFDHISEFQIKYLFVETWYFNKFLTTYAVIPTKSYETCRLHK